MGSVETLLYQIVELVYLAYIIMLFVYILSSWIPSLRESNFIQIVGKFVEPILSPFRRIIPSIGGLDLSPIVAFFALRLAHFGARTLIGMIFDLIGR
jgi:YggT family protein